MKEWFYHQPAQKNAWKSLIMSSWKVLSDCNFTAGSLYTGNCGTVNALLQICLTICQRWQMSTELSPASSTKRFPNPNKKDERVLSFTTHNCSCTTESTLYTKSTFYIANVLTVIKDWDTSTKKCTFWGIF